MPALPPPTEAEQSASPQAPELSVSPEVARGLSSAVVRAESRVEFSPTHPAAPGPSEFLLRRHNMIHRTAERWRPPLFSSSTTWLARTSAGVRRFLDLQAGSIWRDLKAELARPHSSVLDVGCGAQPYRMLVHAADRYAGIDIADAKDYFGYEVPDTTYYTGDRWPVNDASAGLVLCTETLEHVRDPGVFLKEAARACRPGGKLLLTVPFAARWHFKPHDYWRYTPSSLRDLLEEQGFGDIFVFARGNHVTVACYKAMALMLPLLMPSRKRPVKNIFLRLLGLLLSPLLLVLAVIANISLATTRGGDDCLGFTAIATRHRPTSPPTVH